MARESADRLTGKQFNPPTCSAAEMLPAFQTAQLVEDVILKLAFVQAPTAQQLANAVAAEQRGEIEPFLYDLQAVRDELLRRGVEVRETYSGEQLPSLGSLRADEIFAFGSLTTMWRWLRRFGWDGLLAPSYPTALQGYLNRRTWFGTAGELLAGPAAAIKPIFIKPCRPCFPDGERIDGAVSESLNTLADMDPSFLQERFCCSEVVGWVSEYRCYVMHGQLLGIHSYQLLGKYCGRVDSSDLERYVPDLRPSGELVAEAIAKLEASGEATDGYAIDFGMIANGQMSLVELNDAVALTNYGLPIVDYVDLHYSRWLQLARTRTS